MNNKQELAPVERAAYPFQNPKLALEERVADLLSRMTLEEKARQLDLYSSNEFRPAGTAELDDPAGLFDLDAFCGMMGSAGMGCLQNRNTTAAVNNRIQRAVLETARLPVPVLLSEEALHGLIWPGYTIFPQQIALAGTFEPETGLCPGTRHRDRGTQRRGVRDMVPRAGFGEGIRAGAVWKRDTERIPIWRPRSRGKWSGACRANRCHHRMQSLPR